MKPKLIVVGAAGRMGRRIAALAIESGEFEIVGAVDRRGDAVRRGRSRSGVLWGRDQWSVRRRRGGRANAATVDRSLCRVRRSAPPPFPYPALPRSLCLSDSDQRANTRRASSGSPPDPPARLAARPRVEGRPPTPPAREAAAATSGPQHCLCLRPLPHGQCRFG